MNGKEAENVLVAGPAELLDEAMRLRLAVGRLQRRIRTRERDSAPLQIAVLSTIRRRGRCSLSELARIEAVNLSTMSRVVAALVRRGDVVREVDTSDARKVTIGLTSTGSARLAVVLERRTLAFGRGLGTLPAEQRRAISEALPILELLVEGEV